MLGDKIVELRKLKNMTQSDLGTLLNISPQAVSKWERNISQPDFDTIKKMSKVFNVSITEFMEDDDSVVNTENNTSSEKKITCTKCGKFFDEHEMFSLEPEPVCLECNAESLKEKEELDNMLNNKKNKTKIRIKKSFRASFIYAGLITFAVVLFFIIGLWGDGSFGENFALVSMIALFTYCFSNQMFYDNILRDFVDWFRCRGFALPGLIFNLDFGGLLLLVLWKVIAPAIAILISICIFIFGCILAYFISPFTFIFSVMKNYKENKKILKDEVV